METAQLKKFAQEARKSLLNFVKAKLDVVIDKDSLARSSSPKAVEALDGLIKEIGKDEVIEKVAYTWFNRFCALRFMDANRYTKIGIVSPAEGETLPEIFSEAKQNFIDDKIVNAKNITKIKNLLNGTEVSLNPQDDAYRILLVSYCNYYHDQLSFMFEKIDDYTELLMPDDLLSKNSVLYKTVEILDTEACKDVEVIGWLYQYYISEKKDEVFANLKKGKKISKENVPAATQIFTPKWIVSYMVENSVGKLWLEAHPDERLQSQFKYYFESAEQEPEVQSKLKEIIDANIKPQDIKVLDPACGSGHILVKAFDVLYAIYKNEGYSDNEIPETILKNNLFGLDICDRASQLAQFAVMMKARQYDRSIFTKIKSLNICSIKDTNWMDSFVIEEILQKCPNNPNSRKQVELLRDTFKDAKEYGSIINVKGIDFDFWNNCLDNFKNESQIRAYTPIIRGRLPNTLKQARIMQQQYECVIANPPYMSNKGMNSNLISYVKKKYPMSKGDMFAVFKEVIINHTKKNYYSATINQHSWMFISSYEQLREYILDNVIIDTMAHLGTRAFEELSGEVVQTTTYVTKKYCLPNYTGKFIKLTDYPNPKLKEEKFLELNNNDIYISKQNDFKAIPGAPIAYWASPQIRNIFETNEKLGTNSPCRKGMFTGNNDLFLKLWFEVSDMNNYEYYSKGGEFRKWYGNNEYVIYWKNNGAKVKNYDGSGNIVDSMFFKTAITWSLITTRAFTARYQDNKFVTGDAGPMCYPSNDNLKYILGLLNTNIARYLLNLMNPTMNFSNGVVGNFPVIYTNPDNKNKIDSIVNKNISISKNDWDSYETSWDFKENPLIAQRDKISSGLANDSYQAKPINLEKLPNNEYKEVGAKPNCYIQDCFYKWEEYKKQQFNDLKSNEEELNKLFIEIYGLQNEMDSTVEDKDITLKGAAETEKDCIKSLISYAVGCMFGRYSLDQEGLIFAGGEFDKSKYKIFPADDDGVIPILSEHKFSDDITTRFKEFLRIAFGETHYDENLDYVAGVLGKKNNETADEVLRNYFMKDFYSDHLKMYQKRPIYWMFSSPKGNFNALIYMHRYNKDTVSIVLNSYLQEYINKLYDDLKECKAKVVSVDSTQIEKTKAQRDVENIQNIVKEVEDYGNDILYPLATERKEIDLDDGVKVNYLKFGKALKDFGLKAK